MSGEYMDQQMQQLMESGEHEFNELMEKYAPPDDWDYPKWELVERVHNWRNYVSDGLREEWSGFTGRQKIILSSDFNEIASNESWE